MKRVDNFNAGPSALPLPVLEKARDELLNYRNSGMSVMELSHRSKAYDEVHHFAKQLLRDIMKIPDSYDILFLQGGASLQFAMFPLNFLKKETTGYYSLTGSWSEKAYNEAKKVGNVKIVNSSKEEHYTYIPSLKEPNDPTCAYVHITSNNTIFGTQWHEFPRLHAPLIADMSSDLLSRHIDVEAFDFIYAGAQKNLGPSGVTVVIVKKELLQKANANLPTYLQYQAHAEKSSLLNTPPTFSIYMLSLVLEWVQHEGGLSVIEKRNEQKANMLYEAIDESDGFYIGHASLNSRSRMNVTFTLSKEETKELFLEKASEAGFIGLNGHRSIGGCRASIYNAVSVESCERLAQFMEDFKVKYS